MKRMFKWKGVLICATGRESAWERLTVHVREFSDCADITEWEREVTRCNGDPVYDEVDPREYLHAVDPEEYLEILDDHLPPGLITVSDEVYAESAAVVVHLDARSWATLLPIGWMHVPD